MPDEVVVETRQLSRSYRAVGAADAVVGVQDVSLTVARGEIVAITGPSGSGKSTLLFLLAGLDRPDSGSVLMVGTDWQSLRGRAQARWRRTSCAYIAQGYGLLPQATAAENVEVALLLDATPAHERAERVEAALARVEMLEHAAKLPDELSGGQQQRIAIARSLVRGAPVIIADEPTASLDSENAQSVVELLVESARDTGAAVILVTHDPAVARHAGRQLRMRSGRLEAAAPP